MRQTKLEKLGREWQKILRLADYDISFEEIHEDRDFPKDSMAKGERLFGCVNTWGDEETARVFVSTRKRLKEFVGQDGIEIVNPESVLVHELVHVLLYDLVEAGKIYKDNDELKERILEDTTNKLTKILLSLRKEQKGKERVYGRRKRKRAA